MSRGGAYEEAMDIIKNLTERGASNAYTDAILKTIGKFRDLYDIVIPVIDSDFTMDTCSFIHTNTQIVN